MYTWYFLIPFNLFVKSVRQTTAQRCQLGVQGSGNGRASKASGRYLFRKMASGRRRTRTSPLRRGESFLCRSLLLLGCSSLLLDLQEQCHAMPSAKSSLVELSIHVMELTPDSFAGIMGDPRNPWVINAYSPGCPHCKKFAPKVRTIHGVVSCGDFSSCDVPHVVLLSYPSAKEHR